MILTGNGEQIMNSENIDLFSGKIPGDPQAVCHIIEYIHWNIHIEILKDVVVPDTQIQIMYADD
jgi:hypothetical protein